jgi:hypothetical protein
MKASEAKLQQEIDEIKKRVSSLEKAFDSVLTKDDSEAMEEGVRISQEAGPRFLPQVKKKRA